jgi:ABC-2 type transport system permease protein
MSATTSSTGRTAGGRASRTAATPSALGLGLARTGIELRQFFRERDSMVFTFAFPVIMLFIFGSVFSGDIGGGVSFTQYFTAGMIASGIVLSSFQSLAIGIAVERDDGSLKRLRGTPMPPASYFLGKIGMVLVTSVVQTGVLLAVGWLLFGLDLPASAALWLRFAWIFVLGTAAGTVVGIAYSSVPRSSRSAAAVVSPVVIVLQFISGVFFIFTELPTWMQSIGSVFPLKWLAQGMRSVFLPETFQSQEAGGTWGLPQTALVLAAWTVVGLVLALRTFRWSRRDAG